MQNSRETRIKHALTLPPKQMESHLRTLQKKRTANFREDETKLLIQLWGSPSIQNKLFLTHRKAPVMRLLAANMQQHGFYRTPDEIKTRIRNLKCLYHRIKRTMACGTGIGTVDPDWPHFKAMDDILSKEYPRKETSRIMEEVFEGGPKVENYDNISIKEEVEDVDDDNDSWATNESLNSEYEDDTTPTPPPLKPAPTAHNVQQQQLQQQQQKKTIIVQHPTSRTITQTTQSLKTQKLPTILPAFSLPTTQVTTNNTTAKPGGLPFPLLILNGLQPQSGDKTQTAVINQNAFAAQQQKSNATNKSNIQLCFLTDVKNPMKSEKSEEDVPNLLKELIEMQKENLEVQRQKLDVEKQRLEFDRLIGTQLVTLIPMLGGIMQRLTNPNIEDSEAESRSGKKRKRQSNEEMGIMKDCKILKNMLEQGIKKYMMLGEDEKDSDNEDSGIHNDAQSISSEKSDK